ncbi:MAG: type II toxin-antitoxin system HicA family toxin [Planctomycetota bacterium]
MDREKLLLRLVRGELRNVDFSDLTGLVQGFGFELVRIKGSHHIFRHPAIPELLNLQKVHGEGKPYQISQFLRLVERHNLSLERIA